jgi:hypothetical protein
MKFVLLLAAVLMFGCASLTTVHDDEIVMTKTDVEQSALGTAEASMEKAQYEVALKQFRQFQQTYPQSYYLQAARLGEARALSGLEKWSDAIAIERDVYLKTVKDQPTIAALAQYQASFGYEALGEDVKELASLLDTERLADKMPSTVANAELPARLASVYARLGREAEAMQYLNKAEKGLAKLIEEKGVNISNDWLAKTYYQMGRISTAQLAVENYDQLAQSQKVVQVYLLKAVKLNDGVWSHEALQDLKETYLNFFNQFNSQDVSKSERISMGGSLVELINHAQLYRPMSAKKMNALEKDLFAYLSELKKRTETALYQNEETMGLSIESQQLNQLKRELPIKKSPVPSKPKVLTSEDPNL